MQSQIDVQTLKNIFRHVSRAINANRNYLSQLDGQIGDSDHGTTMAEGFNAVVRALHDIQSRDVVLGDVFKLAAHRFLNAVGATCGPLYASGFLSAATFVGDAKSLPLAQFPALILSIGQGIQTRGKAKLGDKTMIDLWLPMAQDLLDRFASEESLEHALMGSLSKVNSKVSETKAMIALKGRASHLGERTLGHIDPGAMSAGYILTAMIEVLLKPELILDEPLALDRSLS